MPEFGNASLGTILTVAAGHAGTYNSDDQFNQYGKGLLVLLSLTKTSGTISVVPHIQGKIGATYYDILVGAAITDTLATPRLFRIAPYLTASANLIAADALPASWRVQLVSATGSSPVFEATIEASVML